MAMIGTKYSELSRPKLSSFSIDMKTLGKQGMNVLAKLINDNKQIITEKLAFEYVKRGSTLQFSLTQTIKKDKITIALR